MTASEIAELVASQKRFFLSGKTKDVAFRKEQLTRLKGTLLKYQDSVVKALAQDFCSDSAEAYAMELVAVVSHISFMIRHVRAWSRPRLTGIPLAFLPGKSQVVAEPFGCTLILTPWTSPFRIPLLALASAVCAGNCVVLKPAHAPRSSEQLLAVMLREVFSQEHVAVVTGGNEVHQPLMGQKYDFIFFAGSGTTGRKVMEIAARSLTPVYLGLGGKNPCIVDSSADIEVAARRIVWGKLVNSGQSCTAPDYVLVQEERKDSLIAAICRHVVGFYGENPVATESPLPSIIDERHFFRVLNLANGNNAANGRVIPGSPSGALYNKDARKIIPTILDSPKPESPVMQDEILGPVLPVIPVKSVEVAMEMVRQRGEPLALYLFSQDKAVQDRVMGSLRYGGGCVNDTVLHSLSVFLPFGGTGRSGLGSCHGRAGFDAFSHRKSILARGVKFDAAIRYPPYGERVMRMLKFFCR